MQIPILPPSSGIEDLRKALHNSDVIMDAIFGFSFKPPIRAPFDAVLPLLNESRLPIVSVDIPSGWDVEEGNNLGVGLKADVLLSLTAPKQGVVNFMGRHFLGGRFMPKYVLKPSVNSPIKVLIHSKECTGKVRLATASISWF